jgi:hypothetical protein
LEVGQRHLDRSVGTKRFHETCPELPLGLVFARDDRDRVENTALKRVP